MTITTKLNVGDYGVFVDNNKVESRKIHKIDVETTEHWTAIFYNFDGDASSSHSNRGKVQIIKRESEVFATKKELLESL